MSYNQKTRISTAYSKHRTLTRSQYLSSTWLHTWLPRIRATFLRLPYSYLLKLSSTRMYRGSSGGRFLRSALRASQCTLCLPILLLPAARNGCTLEPEGWGPFRDGGADGVRSWVHKNLTEHNHRNHLPPDFLCVKGKSLPSCLASITLDFGLPRWLRVKNQPANAGDIGSIPGSGRSPGEGNGNLIQYSSLENPMDRETWWATVHGVAKSWTRLSN